MSGSVRLTDFISTDTLRRLLSGFAEGVGCGVRVVDGGGCVLVESEKGCEKGEGRSGVGIKVGGVELGKLELVGGQDGEEGGRFLHVMADAIEEMCRQGTELRDRIGQQNTLFELSNLLASQHDLHGVLDTLVESVVELFDLKAAGIRLLDEDKKELRVEAVCNLSAEYLNKGAILVSRSQLDQRALRGEVVYVGDLATDPSALYPEDARREGLTSFLVAGMAYRGQSVGVLRAYSRETREFTDDEKNLLHAVAQLAAAAVHSARQVKAQSEGRRIQRQVQLAADVQRQMLPAKDPVGTGYEVAGIYDPCFELGGDFYDFIELEDSNVGIILGDVVGKGVGASLLMASVRASLRAHAEDVYDLDEVMSRVNRALYRDTLDSQFATVFYGTIDTKTMRLTYSSAGHEPSILWRHGEVKELQTGGMALGIDPGQGYDKGIEHLETGDVLLFYSDGVTDAFHFSGERFGRERLVKALGDTHEQSAREIGHHVLWEVRRFMGLNDQTDDMTLVVVKITGDGSG